MKNVCAKLLGSAERGHKTVVVAEIYEDNEPQGMYINILFDPEESIINLGPDDPLPRALDYFVVEQREFRVSQYALWKPLLLCPTVPVSV